MVGKLVQQWHVDITAAFKGNPSVEDSRNGSSITSRLIGEIQQLTGSDQLQALAGVDLCLEIAYQERTRLSARVWTDFGLDALLFIPASVGAEYFRNGEEKTNQLSRFVQVIPTTQTEPDLYARVLQAVVCVKAKKPEEFWTAAYKHNPDYLLASFRGMINRSPKDALEWVQKIELQEAQYGKLVLCFSGVPAECKTEFEEVYLQMRDKQPRGFAPMIIEAAKKGFAMRSRYELLLLCQEVAKENAAAQN